MSDLRKRSELYFLFSNRVVGICLFKVVQLAKGPKKIFLVISRIVWFMYCYVVIYKIAAQ